MQSCSNPLNWKLKLNNYVFGFKLAEKKENNYIKNFESGNIQHTNEVLLALLCVQRLITFLNQEFEEPVEHSLKIIQKF